MSEETKITLQEFEDLKNLVNGIATEDATKFIEKGNASAGTRLRQHMQDVKAKAQDVRNAVTAIKKK